jgi:hypothetical protein
MSLKAKYKDVLLYLYFAILFLVLMFSFGYFFKNSIYNLNVFIVVSSFIEYVYKNNGLLNYIIESFRNPVLSPFLNGLPFYIVNYFIYIIIKNPYSSLVLTNVFFMFISFVSTYLLLKKFNINKFVSVTFSFIFLLQPFIRAHIEQYVFIGINFALLPFYILTDIYVFEKLNTTQRLINYFLLFTFFLFIRLFSLFMDGYGFIISSVFSGFLLGYFLIKNITEKKLFKSAVTLFTFVFSYVISYFLYTLSVHTSSFYVMPIDFFRAMGVDLITLFVPHKIVYLFFNLLNFGTNYNGLNFYSDGSSVYFNYLGYTMLISSLIYILFQKKKEKYFFVLLIAAITSFFLSLGPSLKFNNQRNVGNRSVVGTIEHEDYLMPKEKALFSFGTDFIYLKIPGIKNMRSVYRWIILFKFFFIVCSALFFDLLFKKDKIYFKILGYFLLIIIILEFFPNVPHYLKIYKKKYQSLSLIEKDLVIELKKYLNKGEIVYFISSDNDFIADYLKAKLDINIYNKGGDKAIELLYNYWPYIIKKLRQYNKLDKKELIETIEAGFKKDIYDVVIFPYFNLRWASYYWPPKKDYIDNEKIKFESILKYFEKNSDYILIKSEFFSLLRLKNKKVKENISNFTVFYDFYDNFKKAKIVGNNNAKGLNPWGKRVTILPVLFRTKKMIYSMSEMNVLYKVNLNNLSNSILYFYTKLGPHPEIKDFKSKNGTYLCDGFRMKVNIVENNNTYEILNKYIYPDDEEQEYFLDISDYKNKTFNFEFSVENDKGKNNMSDWALWINPRLILTTNKIPYSRKIVLANKVQDLKFLSPIIDFSKSSFDNQLGRGWYRYEDYFRWIGKEAEAILKNPDTNSTNFKLIIKGWANLKQYFIKRLKVSIYINGEKVKDNIVNKNGIFNIECDINKKLEENVKVKIELNKTFVPKNGDTRNLGIIVNYIGLTNL